MASSGCRQEAMLTTLQARHPGSNLHCPAELPRERKGKGNTTEPTLAQVPEINIICELWSPFLQSHGKYAGAHTNTPHNERTNETSSPLGSVPRYEWQKRVEVVGPRQWVQWPAVRSQREGTVCRCWVQVKCRISDEESNHMSP